MEMNFLSTDVLLDWISKHGVMSRSSRTWELLHHSTKNPVDFTLWPTPSPPYLYRGQVRRYSPCLPSIVRGVTKPVRVLNELSKRAALTITTNLIRAAWYCRLLDAHPVLRWAKEYQHYLDRMALAQHYGIPTGYIDVTESLEVALFFATHEFQNGVAKPSATGTGILYRVDRSALPESLAARFQPIGIQPFARPFRQWAWTCELLLGESFEGCPGLQAVEFVQDEEFSIEVGRRAEQSGLLFPPDFLADLAAMVNYSSVLPEEIAVETVEDLCAEAWGFAGSNPVQLLEELRATLARESRVVLSGSVPEFFSNRILSDLESDWRSQKPSFLSSINNGLQFRLVRTVAGGTIELDADNSGSAFKTDLSSSFDDGLKDCVIVFTSGILKDQARRVTAYEGSTRIISVNGPFVPPPVAGDRFTLSASGGPVPRSKRESAQPPQPKA